MSDVNFVEYGANAVRVLDSGEDFLSFAEMNGEAIGAFLAFILIMFFFGIILILGYMLIPKIIKSV